MFQISYHESNVKQAVHTKLLGLGLDHHMNWKTHIDKIIPKLCSASYIIRSVYFLNDVSTFTTIYYAYFHSVMKYSIILQGNSPFSKKVMTGSLTRVLCKPLFKKLEILTMQSQHTLSLMMFLVNNFH
jgi:hypothetical protein